MVRRVLFLGLFTGLSLATLPSAAQAQQRHHCEWLLDKGIYDTESDFVDRHSFEVLMSLLNHSHAGSVMEFEQEIKDAGIGIPIPKLGGVLGIKFGGHDANAKFKEWREAFLNTSHHELAHDETLRREVRKISPTLMEAVKECIKHAPEGRVVAWLTPSQDALIWTLTAKYVSRGKNDDCTIETFSVTPTPGSAEVSIASKQQEAFFAKGKKIDGGESGLELTRRNTKDGAVISIGTTRGYVRLEIPGNTTPDPLQMIADLHKRMKFLEDGVKNLEQRVPVVVGAKKIGFVEHENVPNVGYTDERGNAAGLPLPRACRDHQWTLPGEYGKGVIAVWHVVIDGKPTGEPFKIRNEIRGKQVIVHFDAPNVEKAGIRVVWRVLFEK